MGCSHQQDVVSPLRVAPARQRCHHGLANCMAPAQPLAAPSFAVLGTSSQKDLFQFTPCSSNVPHLGQGKGLPATLKVSTVCFQWVHSPYFGVHKPFLLTALPRGTLQCPARCIPQLSPQPVQPGTVASKHTTFPCLFPPHQDSWARHTALVCGFCSDVLLSKPTPRSTAFSFGSLPITAGITPRGSAGCPGSWLLLSSLRMPLWF